MIIYNDIAVCYKNMRILDCVVDAAPERAGELVRAQIRNRLGWSELEAFQSTGQFLMKHPILQKKKLAFDLKKMKSENPKKFLEQYADAELSVIRYKSQLENKKWNTELQRDNWTNKLELHQEKQNIIYAIIEETNAIQPNSKTT